MYDNIIMYMYKYVKIIMYDKSVMCDKIVKLKVQCILLVRIIIE